MQIYAYTSGFGIFEFAKLNYLISYSLFAFDVVYRPEFVFLHSFLLIDDFIPICHFYNVPIWPILNFVPLSIQIRFPTLLFRIVNLSINQQVHCFHSILRQLNLHVVIVNLIIFNRLHSYRFCQDCNQSTHFYLILPYFQAKT